MRGGVSEGVSGGAASLSCGKHTWLSFTFPFLSIMASPFPAFFSSSSSYAVKFLLRVSSSILAVLSIGLPFFLSPSFAFFLCSFLAQFTILGLPFFSIPPSSVPPFPSSSSLLAHLSIEFSFFFHPSFLPSSISFPLLHRCSVKYHDFLSTFPFFLLAS